MKVGGGCPRPRGSEWSPKNAATKNVDLPQSSEEETGYKRSQFRIKKKAVSLEKRTAARRKSGKTSEMASGNPNEGSLPPRKANATNGGKHAA